MEKAAVHFDAQTIAFLKVALDEAWDRLPPKLQATMLKTTLAERILKSAAEGERNRKRLREAALRDLAAWRQQTVFALLPPAKNLRYAATRPRGPAVWMQSSSHVRAGRTT